MLSITSQTHKTIQNIVSFELATKDDIITQYSTLLSNFILKPWVDAGYFDSEWYSGSYGSSYSRQGFKLLKPCKIEIYTLFYLVGSNKYYTIPLNYSISFTYGYVQQ